MFDSTTLNVFLIILLIVGVWVFILWTNTRTMHKHIQQVAQQQSVIRHDDAARSLCRAIHTLEPAVHAGIDYIIKDDPGKGPYIAQWLNTTIPQPKPEQLEQALETISGIDPVKDHAAQRLREYPSVGDQLDAAYKARHGDTADQVKLDEQISKIKQKYPKSDECL
jgi:Ca2+/H+ antiporter